MIEEITLNLRCAGRRKVRVEDIYELYTAKGFSAGIRLKNGEHLHPTCSVETMRRILAAAGWKNP